MRPRTAPLFLALLFFAPSFALGQSFDAPAFHPPRGEDDLGLYVVFPNEVTDVGAAATFRKSGADVDLGFRGAAYELSGSLALAAGVDVKNQLVAAGPTAPVDVAWVTGVGVSGVPDRDVAQVRIPLGFSVGRTLGGGDVSLTPYVYPRLALDFSFRPEGRRVGGPLGAGRAGDDSRLHGDVDLGFDAVFVPGWKFRFALTLGHNEAVGAGISIAYF